jgi:hypothetical protein
VEHVEVEMLKSFPWLRVCCFLGIVALIGGSLAGCRFLSGPSSDDSVAAVSAEGEASLREGTIPLVKDPVTESPAALQNEISALLSEYQSVLSPAIRQPVPKAQIPPISLPTSLPLQLPDFTGKYLSLSTKLSDVLSGIPATGGLESIPDLSAFMQKYQLSTATLELLVSKAKGVLVNLADLSPETLKNHPVVKAALEAKIPLIFENSGTLADYRSGWSSESGAQGVKSMAAAVGVGVSAHINIVLPPLKSVLPAGAIHGSTMAAATAAEEPGEADLDVVSLGAQGEEQAENGNTETASSDDPPVNDGFSPVGDPEEAEVPEEEEGGGFGTVSEAEAASIRASTNSVIDLGELPKTPFTHINDPAFKVVKTGSAPKGTDKTFYRSFTVKPRGRTEWTCNNGLMTTVANHLIEYKVQLSYALNGKRYVRIHTMKSLDKSGMTMDSDSNRGYFQYSHRVKMYPIDPESGNPAALPNLKLVQSSPRFHAHTEGLLKKVMSGKISVPSELQSAPTGNEDWSPLVSLTSLPCGNTLLIRAIAFFHHGFKTFRYRNNAEGVKWYSRICQVKYWSFSSAFAGWAINETITRDPNWINAIVSPAPSIAILGAVHSLVKEKDKSFFNKILYYAAQGTWRKVDSWKDFIKVRNDWRDFVCAPPLAALSEQRLPYQAVWEMTGTGSQRFLLETRQSLRSVWRDFLDKHYRDTTHLTKRRKITVDFSSVGP